MQMSEFEKGFIAGMIEGEGCLTFINDISQKFRVISPRVSISNTSLPLLKYCKKIIGKGCIVQQKVDNKNRKCWYDLKLKSQRDILELLTLINPHLVSKRKDAEILLEFIKSRLSKPDWKKRYVDTMKRLYLSNLLSTYEIAEKFRCSPTTVKNILKSEGVELRKSGRKLPKVYDDAEFEKFMSRRKYTQLELELFEMARKLHAKRRDKNGYYRGAMGEVRKVSL